MKKFITTVQDIWKIEELRNKIMLTLGLMVVYRLAAQVPLPGIDPTQLSGLANKTSDGLLGLLNAFTGGAFAKASVMALLFLICRSCRRKVKAEGRRSIRSRDG